MRMLRARLIVAVRVVASHSRPRRRSLHIRLPSVSPPHPRRASHTYAQHRARDLRPTAVRRPVASPPCYAPVHTSPSPRVSLLRHRTPLPPPRIARSRAPPPPPASRAPTGPRPPRTYTPPPFLVRAPARGPVRPRPLLCYPESIVQRYGRSLLLRHRPHYHPTLSHHAPASRRSGCDASARAALALSLSKKTHHRPLSPPARNTRA